MITFAATGSRIANKAAKCRALICGAKTSRFARSDDIISKDTNAKMVTDLL